MSTISTHLNWGSSYIVNDFYKRFLKPNASEKEMVNVGRASTVILMVFSAVLALYLDSAIQAFRILLSIGAGTGLIFILRWFWWRINAYTEIAGMIISLFVAVYFEVIHERLGFDPINEHYRLVLSVVVTTVAWLIVTLLTRPTDSKTLVNFYNKIKPAKVGWKTFIVNAEREGFEIEEGTQSRLSVEVFSMVIGCFTVFSVLFSTGYFLYGKPEMGALLAVLALIGGVLLKRAWGKLKFESES